MIQYLLIVACFNGLVFFLLYSHGEKVNISQWTAVYTISVAAASSAVLPVLLSYLTFYQALAAIIFVAITTGIFIGRRCSLELRENESIQDTDISVEIVTEVETLVEAEPELFQEEDVTEVVVPAEEEVAEEHFEETETLIAAASENVEIAGEETEPELVQEDVTALVAATVNEQESVAEFAKQDLESLPLEDKQIPPSEEIEGTVLVESINFQQKIEDFNEKEGKFLEDVVFLREAPMPSEDITKNPLINEISETTEADFLPEPEPENPTKFPTTEIPTQATISDSGVREFTSGNNNIQLNAAIDSGFAAKFSGDVTEAILLFKKAIALNPPSDLKQMISLDIFSMYKELGHYAEAKDFLNKFLEDEQDFLSQQTFREIAQNIKQVEVYLVPQIINVAVQEALALNEKSDR